MLFERYASECPPPMMAAGSGRSKVLSRRDKIRETTAHRNATSVLSILPRSFPNYRGNMAPQISGNPSPHPVKLLK